MFVVSLGPRPWSFFFVWPSLVCLLWLAPLEVVWVLVSLFYCWPCFRSSFQFGVVWFGRFSVSLFGLFGLF